MAATVLRSLTRSLLSTNSSTAAPRKVQTTKEVTSPESKDLVEPPITPIIRSNRQTFAPQALCSDGFRERSSARRSITLWSLSLMCPLRSPQKDILPTLYFDSFRLGSPNSEPSSRRTGLLLSLYKSFTSRIIVRPQAAHKSPLRKSS